MLFHGFYGAGEWAARGGWAQAGPGRGCALGASFLPGAMTPLVGGGFGLLGFSLLLPTEFLAS